MESERVKMESKGKLGNDGKVKFVEPRKSVRWREKTCGPGIYVNGPYLRHVLFSRFSSSFNMGVTCVLL